MGNNVSYEYDTERNELEFCTATIDPETGLADEECTITVIASSGYDFSEAANPTVNVYYEDSYYNDVVRSFPLTKINDSEYRLDNWIFANETDNLGNSYIKEIDNNSTIYYSVTAIASARTSISDSFGTSQLYKLTSENLKSLASSRLVKNSDDTTTDIGQFIISLMKLFIVISDDNLTKDNLKLFTYTSNIQCEAINALYQKIDCGLVNMPLLLNTECKILLYLPFYGIADISEYKNEFSEKPISLVYKVNISNGDSLITVKCLDLELFYNCNVGYNIPFFMNTYNNPSLNKDLTIDSSFLSDNYIPYIYIVPEKTFNLEILGITEKERDLLKTVIRNGFIKESKISE